MLPSVIECCLSVLECYLSVHECYLSVHECYLTVLECLPTTITLVFMSSCSSISIGLETRSSHSDLSGSGKHSKACNEKRCYGYKLKMHSPGLSFIQLVQTKTAKLRNNLLSRNRKRTPKQKVAKRPRGQFHKDSPNLGLVLRVI